MTDTLYMDDDTTVEEVLDYLEARLEEPTILSDVVVFNFHAKSLKAQPLAEWANDADPGIYVMPYQVSGVWAFMVDVLPVPVAHADVLKYNSKDESYGDYERWSRYEDLAHSDARKLIEVTPWDRIPEDVLPEVNLYDA